MTTLEKPQSHAVNDPNYMSLDDKKTNSLIEVEGAGLVPARETASIPLDLLHPVTDQAHNLPPSHEVVQHEIEAARELGSKALHEAMEDMTP